MIAEKDLCNGLSFIVLMIAKFRFMFYCFNMTDDAHTSRKRRSKAKYIILTILGIFACLIIMGMIATVNAAREAEKAAAQEAARLAADPVSVPFIYNALNKERATNGATALATIQNLSTAAEQFCSDMVVNKYFDYKNPATAKSANDYITDNVGDYYFKTYVASIFSASYSTETASEAVTRAVSAQATNLNNPSYNSVGWAICDSPDDANLKYIVGMFAEKAEKPVAPTTVYVPAAPRTPIYTPPTTCNTTYYDGYGYMSPSATTHCY
jgi:hypothetical protein